MVLPSNRMLARLYDLYKILKIRMAYSSVIDDYSCSSARDPFSNLAKKAQRFDRVTETLKITPRKHLNVHLGLRPFTMQDAPRVVANDWVVVCVVLALRSCELAGPVAVQKVGLFIFNDFSTEFSVVKITKLLVEPTCDSSMLGCDETRVEIAAHKLFDTAELNVLEE